MAERRPSRHRPAREGRHPRVQAFNEGDVDRLAELYRPDAVNHQVAETPVEGRDAIRSMFVREFAKAEMVCIVENLFEDGDWAILEWRDPKGLRGCGFFHCLDGQIALHRGYWDELSFLRLHGLTDFDSQGRREH